MVSEPEKGNLEKVLFELLQFSGSTLALSKYNRLTEEKPGEGEYGGYERSTRPEVKISMILSLRI